jgi:hypothetical protein
MKMKPLGKAAGIDSQNRLMAAVQLIARIRQAWPSRAAIGDSLWESETPAWLLSMLLHLAILVAMTLIVTTQAEKEPPLRVEATTVEPVDPLEQSEEFTYSEIPQEEIGASSAGNAEADFALAPVMSLEATPGELEIEEPPVALDDMAPMLEEVRIATGPKFTENVPVMGSAGVGAVGTGGAIDRLTQEILLKLEERPTLVVWLFDQSGSLAKQRAEIAKRFGRIYDELGVIEASQNEAFAKHEDKPLLTSIVAFGQNVTFLTPKPTDDIEEIKAAVGAVENDESGMENTFGAVAQVIDRYRPLRTREPRRNVMLVLFTDEAGDDDNQLDRTVQLARRLEIPVYCVGVPAPFGRRDVAVKYVDPDPKYDQSPQWIPVRQGPESFMPELVKIGDETEEALDSGFGPYSLTRLCYETGGLYFAVHPNRKVGKSISRRETALLSAQLSHFFEPEKMLAYRPDYVPIKEYERLLKENKAREALVTAAQMSWITPLERPTLEFPKVNDADLAGRLSRAQQAAAVLEPKINRLYEALSQGVKDRAKLTVPRWQAGFDLSMGRVLALKVRTEGYNAMLAKAKQGMRFADAKNDTWELVRDDEISVGSVLEKQAAEAKKYLERVRDEHPDTPWALVAEQELKVPLGWKWREKHTGVNEPRERPAAMPRTTPAPTPPPKRPPPKL